MHLHRFLGNLFYYALARFIVSRHFPEHQQKALKRRQLLDDAHETLAQHVCIFAIKFHFQVTLNPYKYSKRIALESKH